MNHTSVLRTPLDAAGFTGKGLRSLPYAEGVFAASGEGAVIESPWIETPSVFDDLVGSWNADLPSQSRLTLQAQVRLARGGSAWYALGEALGRTGRRLELSSPGPQEDADGSVAQDTLRLKAPASAFRYRLLLAVPRGCAVLRQAAVAVSDSTCPAEPPPFRRGPWVRRLKVPARSQMVEPAACRRDICSPTSLAAVLEYWGVRRETLEVAERVRDRTTGQFGNWTFAMAVAGALGLEGSVARLDSLDDLAGEVGQGRPVVVSVTFGPGELPGAPVEQTRGHLLVVSGFTPRGDVVVMDPAARTAGQTRRVYDRAAFHRAWRVNKRGLAYLLSPRVRGRRLTVGVPVADLWSSPRSGRGRRLSPADHHSQLIYGENVTVLAADGHWIRVRADEQEYLGRGGAWHGYPGWMKASQLTAALPPVPNAVVRTRHTLVRRGSQLVALSVGTRLERLGEAGGIARVRLLDGGVAEVPADALAPLSAPHDAQCRPLILKTAELFLGTSYYWGGRSGVQPEPSIGVDCSGLVSLAYRACGLDLPRDAHEQRLRSRPVSRSRLKPGDLVFLTAGARSARVTHVMIFTGGDGLIEARQAAGRVLRCTFAERFGQPLAELGSGQVVTDRSGSRPKRRKVFFGSYF